MVHCLGCSNWTLKPRAAEGKHEPLPCLDREYAVIGWGRCLLDGLPRRWYPGESGPGRYCDRHVALPADQVQARRDWIAKQGAKA